MLCKGALLHICHCLRKFLRKKDWGICGERFCLTVCCGKNADVLGVGVMLQVNILVESQQAEALHQLAAVLCVQAQQALFPHSSQWPLV
jgi:hypothetical protein